MFRPRWWGFALAAAAVAGGIALADWQWRRADERRAAAARHAAGLAAPAIELSAHDGPVESLAMRRVLVRGHFVPQHTILLDQRVRERRVGYEVVTPLRLQDDRRHVLVLRGWVHAGASREAVPRPPTPQGEVQIEGLALEGVAQRYAPWGSAREGRVWQNLRIEDARAASGLELLPIVIEQHSSTDDGLDRRWPAPGSGAEKNEMYALQWYSLAALAVVLWFVLSFRRDAPAAD